MIEQASLVIGEGNWAVKSDSLLGYKINGGKYYPREMSVVRATTGTRINEDGLVELVPYNLLQYSEDLSNAIWGKTDVTIASNAIAAPNGTLTADKISSSVNGTLAVYADQYVNGATPINVTHTYSIYAKAGEVTQMLFYMGYLNGIYFNLTTGAFISYYSGAQDIVSYSSENVGNGWFRYNITLSSNDGTLLILFPSQGGNISFPQTIGNGFYVWGAQLNEGTLKDYLPTTDRLDIARIDYSSGSGALLVEPQRTNLLTYSSSFDNAAWTKTDSTITVNNTTSPSGVQDADKLVENNVNSLHAVSQTYSFTSGTAYTLSFYVKKAERTIIQALFNFQVTSAYCNFNSNTGVFNNQGFTSASMVDVGNGWYRCSVTLTSSNTGTYSPFLSIETSINSARATGYTGNGTSGLFLWGAQLESGSYPTSYIPTQAATVTRNADVISKTGIADLIGQTEGVVFAEFTCNSAANTGSYDSIINIATNANNSIDVLKNNTTSELYVFAINGGAIQVNSVGIAGTNVLGHHKVALAYKANDYALYLDGVQVFADTSASVPACSGLYLGHYFAGTGQLGGGVKAAALYKTRLTNTQLQQLTTI